MPVMSKVEASFCRSAPWRAFTGRVVLPWVLQGQTLGSEALEIGSGAGANAAVLAARYPGANITATDIDPAMVTAARARFTRFGDRITISQADTTHLPFDDNRFDTAISLLMLHHVIDWQTAISELARVIRPGGRIVGYDLTATGAAHLLHIADRTPHRLLEPEQLRRQLSTSGFRRADVASGLRGLVFRFHATLGTQPR